MSFRRQLACIATAAIVALGPLLAFGQFGLPSVPAMPGVGAIPGAAGALPGASSAPSTLWRFLGFKGGQRFRNLRDALVNRRGNFPGLEKKPRIKSLTDPDNMKSDNPAIKEAAATKADADAAPQKVKAIKYLATVGCSSNGCYPNVKSALLAALDDCTEEVRYEAAKALLKVAGDNCDSCRESCCDKEVTDKLFSVAYDRTDRCCYKEVSPRVRKMARRALCACATPGPGGAPPPQPTEGPKGDPDEVPAPAKGAPSTVAQGQDVIRSQFVVGAKNASGVENVAQDVRDTKTTDITGGIKAFLDPHIRSESKTAQASRRSGGSLRHPAARSSRSQTTPAAPAVEPELQPEGIAADPLTPASLAESAGVTPRKPVRPAAAPREPQANANSFYERVQPSGDLPPNEVELAGYEDDDDLDADMGNQVRRAFAERFGLATSSTGRGSASASNTSPFQRNAPPSGLPTRPAPRQVNNPPLNPTPTTRPGTQRPASEANPTVAARTTQPPARVEEPVAPAPQQAEASRPTVQNNPIAPAPWAQEEGEVPPTPLPFEPPAPAPRRIDPNPPIDQNNPFDSRYASRNVPPIETRPIEAVPVPPVVQNQPHERPQTAAPSIVGVPQPSLPENKKPLFADRLPHEEPQTAPPVAAAVPAPKARFGAAKPLIRYGAVRPMVRYGAVKAADEANEEDAVVEAPADETGMSFPDSASRGFSPGTDPWRWANGRLFARAPSRHRPDAWEEPLPVGDAQPSEVSAPRTAERIETNFTSERETTYRR